MRDDGQRDTLESQRKTHGDDPRAADELFGQLRTELHRLATNAMAGERADHTLQATALLHEVWLRVFRARGFEPGTDHSRILHEAARAMRQILVDHARRRTAGKRGGKRRRVALDTVLDYCEEQRLDVHAVHEALDELALTYDRQATVMTLRFFCGFTVQEVASQLHVSASLVENDFRMARAWMRKRLGGGL